MTIFPLYNVLLRVVGLSLPSVWIVLVGTVAAILPQATYGAVDIADTIRNVCSNEELYKDIDVTVQDEYISYQKPLDLQEGFLPIKQHAVDIQYVRQAGMLHLSVRGTVQRITPKQQEETVARNKIRLFDGETSRVLQGSKANIVAGPTTDANLISPHMLILQPCGYPVPLSTYLKGHQAMLACRDLNWDPNIYIRTEYQGEEMVETHPCQKVIIKHIIASSGYLHSAWVLWLALDRNYLPMRCEAYTYSVSKTIPVGQAVSRDLHEIAPGIWFPYEVLYTAFNSIAIEEHQRQELGWRERYTVTKVSLEPHYPAAFFRDLKIPDGTYVYHLNANGKIEQSYVQGAPATERDRTHSVSRRWGFVGCSTVLVILIGVFVMRRYRRYRVR